ncbi:sensor histidine kinase [Terriglobus sp. 2YAB30_2]|uniref:sensor histidine kinase n=1 Tax=Terriglobus sp. 2YAB30_2 TaxID=3233023 RepID=UPI003F95B007
MLFAALCVFGISVWLFLAWTLRTGKEKTLANRANRLSILLREQNDPLHSLSDGTFDDILLGLPEGRYTQIFDRGKRLAPLHPLDETMSWPSISAGVAFSAMTFRGQRYVTFTRTVDIKGHSLVIQIASQYEENYRLLRRLGIGMAAMVPVVLLLSSFGGYVLSGRALRPMERLAETAEQIGLHDLSQHLPIPNTGDEVQHVAEVFNSLLRRLEGALTRQRRFTADASHHLRTPLATARAAAEIALRGDLSTEDVPETLEDVLVEIREMEEIVDGMLQLARFDAEAVEMPVCRLDFATLVTEICHRMNGIASSKGLHLFSELATDDPILLMGHEASLKRLVAALIDNAIRYTPSGSVTVRTAKTLHSVECAVVDTGIGITSEAIPHIFERFFRTDEAKALVNGGSGLGLAIAKWVVERHGGEISASSAEGQFTMVRFSLPLYREPGVKR